MNLRKLCSTAASCKQAPRPGRPPDDYGLMRSRVLRRVGILQASQKLQSLFGFQQGNLNKGAIMAGCGSLWASCCTACDGTVSTQVSSLRCRL